MFFSLIWSLMKVWNSLCSWGWSKTTSTDGGMTGVCHHTWIRKNQGIKHRIVCARQALCQLNHTLTHAIPLKRPLKDSRWEPLWSHLGFAHPGMPEFILLEPCVCGWWLYVGFLPKDNSDPTQSWLCSSPTLFLTSLLAKWHFDGYSSWPGLVKSQRPSNSPR